VSDTDLPVEDATGHVVEVGDYCRQVEDYLTRANGGHLVRIVGPGFGLVRQWAADGIPLRVVWRGIDHKVERHRTGQARRPLRIEFCEADVRDVYENWQRAVGLGTGAGLADAAADETAAGAAPADRRRPSLSKHLDRALERLARTGGRLDLPERLRDGLGAIAGAVAEVRETAKTARGADRDELATRVAALDRDLLQLAREAATADLITDVRRDAEQDLAAYRGRLSGDAWVRAVEATAAQLLRDRLELPTLEP
jgi:hypothetical protein